MLSVIISALIGVGLSYFFNADLPLLAGSFGTIVAGVVYLSPTLLDMAGRRRAGALWTVGVYLENLRLSVVWIIIGAIPFSTPIIFWGQGPKVSHAIMACLNLLVGFVIWGLIETVLSRMNYSERGDE